MKKRDIHLIREVKLYIDNNLEKNLCVRAVCAEFGLNKNKLQWGFKFLYDQTVHNYIVQQKMQRAVEKIKNTNDPIKAIAHDIGCTSSNFHVNFKKTFGHSPEQFRRKEHAG